ncbi:MAG: DUF2207 domain-containing protein [Oscillospiraceae bacterium]|nr:DUF2207 domain-containing protein [Oscillospiraceae bacterium]
MTRAGKFIFKLVLFIFIFVLALFIFIILGLDMGWLSQPTTDNSNYARITAVDYQALVTDEPGGEGKAVITEVLTFDIHARSENYLFYELWRDLPEEYVDGVKVEYNVLSVKQVFTDGRSPVVFEESSKLYWYDFDFIDTEGGFGPGKWFHSKGPYDGERNFECVLFYVDGLYRETVHFEVVYEMTNASLRYADCSEFYITMYAEETINFLKSFKAQVLFPLELMPREGNFYAHTYGTNAHTFPFTESDRINPGHNTFAFELDESQLNFKLFNQYIEFALISFGDDKHIFTQHASYNHYYNRNVLNDVRRNQARYEALPAVFLTAKISVFVLCTAGAALILVMAFSTDKRIRKKYTFFKPEMEIEFFRDIPSRLDPLFASYLVFCKEKLVAKTKDCYSAILLDLVRKGYLELTRISEAFGWTRENTKIVVKNRSSNQPLFCSGCGSPLLTRDSFCPKCGSPVTSDTGAPILEPLTKNEEHYLGMILRYAVHNEITLRTLQTKVAHDYEYSDYFVKAVKRSTTDIGLSEPRYFQTARYKKPKESLKSISTAYWIIGILLATVANLISISTRLELAFGAFFILAAGLIISAIHLNKIAKKYILLTQFGETEYQKWRGLYNFLNSETLMHERTVVDLVIWEQYLVYATAFGISEKVIKALKIRCPEDMMRTSPMLVNPYLRTRAFYTFGRTLGTTARTASYTYRSGSHGGGFGGGGGYGGGGRGGGGGGGGH